MGVDYEFYTGVYDGALVPKADFARAARRAGEILHADTAGGSTKVLAQGGEEAPPVRLALCAIAELCFCAQENALKGGAVVKESVGTWSREYALPLLGEHRAQIVAAEQKYLGYTGLLYRGRARRV